MSPFVLTSHASHTIQLTRYKLSGYFEAIKATICDSENLFSMFKRVFLNP